MATPEIVLGASLLTTVRGVGPAAVHPAGRASSRSASCTILIAHIMFNISYVVVTVQARLQGFPRHLEEAAMDLGANEWTTFWKVTFPLILPGIAGGGPAGVQPVDRRLRHHELHGRPDADVPALHLRLAAARHPGRRSTSSARSSSSSRSGSWCSSTLWQRRVAARDYKAATVA